MKIKLQRVRYMPKELEKGTLYVSEEFGAAAHLCACGCGAKIRTPLGPTDWVLKETINGPSLSPSIGNWQQPCQSHYWIFRGKVVWARKWTEERISAGRRREQARSEAYYQVSNNMNKIKIGSSERELSEANESWINQQVREREKDGQSVCVQVFLKMDNLNIVLSTPQCGGGNGGGRQLNQKESAIVELWINRHLSKQNWEVGNLIAFLKQLRKLI